MTQISIGGPAIRDLLPSDGSGVDLLSTHRSEWITVQLLDHDERYVGAVDIEGGIDLDFSVYDTIRTGGKISVAHPHDIPWHQRRVQITYHTTFPSEPSAEGGQWSRNLGIFIPSSPRGKRGATNAPREVELYDKLLILSQDLCETSFEVLKGAIVTDVIRNLILSAGETHIAVAPSPDTLKANMVFEIGTSKLQIINRLLDAINYFSLWCDGDGRYRADAYVAPRQRVPSPYPLFDGQDSVYVEEFSDSEDDFEIPNRVVTVARTEADAEPFTSFAENRDPNSPYSYQNRRRWITVLETDIEATTQKRLDEITVRRLNELSSNSRTFEVSHPIMPYELNEVLAFTNTANNVSSMCTVQKMSFDLTLPGAMCTTTLREVVWLENE